ncbi:phage tail protein [Pluralibacter gergoviae]|uniref:TipJ family phage tail tip protein n=1 Tax=Pluralibacter gergoviae TaxID=61647 RepID=UPI0007DACDCB|nr:phage tail protein [Pluralibacter gergoviae]
MSTATEIKGRKGGSSKARTPTEQPDDLQSVAKAKILLALGEGEFAGGLTAKDIYLDGTPLENVDGSQNFSGVAWEFRPGTQAQNYIQGIPGSENEISVGTEIKSATAWTHTFTNAQMSAIRLRLKWPSLFTQEDDGDLVGNTVKYAIDLQTDGGSWQTVVDTAATGKTTSGYERSHRIELPQAGSTWTVRLRKITADANSAKIGDKMTLESYTEVIDAKLRYPNTALLYIEFDSSQFNGSIPQIACEPRMRVIRVPDTYNPETREYSGVWTGAFKWAWTDNPAWIFYDLVVSGRFGLGNRLTAENISKWTLYEVAQYCDQLVPDGKGGDGVEPRYTCNVYVQDRNDAYTVLRDFAAIFRGMVYWGGDQIVALADMPRDVDYTYTRANVIDGKFTYSSSSAKTRYTTALVSWSDPANAYSDAMEPVFEQPLVARYGFNQLEMTAIGCTRQSEANRKGRWGILTNNKDRVVTFGVGLDGNIPQPGYIIAVADEMLAGRSNGGRISAVSGRVITFDRSVDAKPGARLQVNLPSGTSQSRTIQSVNGARQVTITTPFSEAPQTESVWAIEWDELYLQQYRVVSVSDNSDGTFTVSGAAHDPDKFSRIDTGAIIDERPVSVVPPGHQAAPEGVSITSYSVVNQGISVETMQASWAAVKNAISYEAQWRRNDGNWVNVPRSSTTSFDVSGIYAGRYLVRVRAINAAEVSSGWAYSEEKTLTGKIGEPLAPVGLATSSLTAGIEISWGFPANSGDTQRTEVQYSKDQNGAGALPLTDVAYPGNRYQQMGLQFAQQFWYRARLVDRLGNKSPWTGWVFGMASDNMDDYYRNLDDAIRDTDTWGELNDGIKDSTDAAQHAQDAADAAQRSVDGMSNDVAKNASDITQAAQQGKANADNLAKEVRDRAAGDLANAKKSADDVAAAVRKAETDDAARAKEAADNLLSAKNDVESQISSTNTTMQDGFDSLAQQIASVSAGTGEQFDSLKIFYFDNKTTEGWTGNNGIVLTDGWIRSGNGFDSYLRSPVDLRVSSDSYRYLKMRIRKVGTPAWEGTVRWISKSGEAFNNTKAFYFAEPEYLNGVAMLSVQDIPWADAGTIYQIRLDMTTSTDDSNYVEIDWVAIGRPTPGASQAQIQDLRSAMTSADAAEAAARNTLAVQLRGNETGTDPNKLVSGLLYNERKARVTAEQAIASDVNTLRTDYNANKASVTQRLDTLTSENQAQANSLTQLDSGLKDANGKIGANSSAIQNLKTSVTAIDGRVSSNSQAITGLTSTLNNMRVGGTNLIPNSGALAGFGDVVSGQLYKGNAIKRLAIAGNAAGSYTDFNFDLPAPFDAEDCVISFYAKASTDKTPISCFLYSPNATIRSENSQGVVTVSESGTDGKTDLTLSLDWVRYWVKWKRKPGQTGGTKVIFGRVYKVSVAREVFISSPKMEIGTVPTEWSEAPADNASATALQGLTTRVDAAEGKIETASQAITQLRGDVSSVQGDLAKKADASALQQLQTTVTQQGNALSTQGSAITELQNSATNGKKNYWVQQLFYIRAPSSTYIPSLSDLAGVQPASISEVADAASLDFTSAGSNVFAYFKALVYVSADKEVICKPGSRVMDDTGQIYINSISVAKLSSTQDTVTLSFKKGWNTIEVVTQQWSGNAYFRLGLKLSDNVDQMFSGAGQLAAASASQVLNSRVEAAEGSITSQGQSITQLNNSLGDVNKTLGNKADASALNSLTTRVSNAEGKLASQGESITSLSNSITAGENLVPNPNMLNDGQGWLKQGSVSTIDGYPALNSTAGWQPSSGKFQVTAGDILDLAVSIQVSAAVSLAVGVRFDGPSVSNVTAYTGDHAFTAGEKYRFEKPGIVVPAGCTTAFLQTNGHTTVTVSLYNPVVTRRTAGTTANAAAINSLTTRVTAAEGAITSQSQSVTALSSSLNRRTVFTVCSLGMGGAGAPGIFSESGARLFLQTRSYALITFRKNGDGSTSIDTSRTYDVFSSVANGKALNDAIAALANGVYACVVTFDEPSGNRASIIDGIRLLGGTPDVINALPYRGAYILLGQKNGSAGSAIELIAPAGGNGSAVISTSVEFVNGIMQGLGGSTGAVRQAEANASAITSLTTRVSSAEGQISSQSQSLTSLQNSLSSSDASVDADGNIPGNMVANASFERDKGGYTTWHEKASIVTGGNFGSKCVKFSPGAAAGIGQKFPVSKGRIYRIGAYAKQDAGTTIANASNTKFRVANASGLIGGFNYGGFTRTWQNISFDWTSPADDVVDIQITAYLSDGAMYFDDFYVLDVTDEKNIQANAGAISSLQSSVTKLGNDITSQSSAVTSLSNSLNTVNQANGNLWVDGSFESYAEGTTFSGATAMVTKAYRYSGGQCLRVRRDGGDKGNSDKTFGTRTTVRDQGVFRIEFYAMMPASESPPSGWVTVVGIHVQDTNGANQWVEAAVVSEVRLGGRDKWVKFSGTAALGGGKTRGVLWISTRGTSGGAGYNLFIDELVITDVTDAAGAQKTADAASSALTSLSTKVTSIDGQVTANSTALTKLTSRVNDAESSITGLNETVAQNGLAMANGFNQMRSMIGDNSASITQTNKTVTDLEKSTAEQVNTLNSKYGDMSATVQQTASTVADINGKLGAQWGVKVATGNGGTPVVAGIQLGINGSGQSQFLVSADMFGVYTPGAGGNAVMAFAVEGANAYLRSAMIKDASIDFAKISDSIQSTNYISGQQGWRINKGGWSEFSGGVYRGTVYANDGVFNGTINARDGKFSGTVEARNFIGDISNSGRFPDFTFDNRDNGVSRIVHHDSGDSSQGKTYTVNGLLFRWNGGGTVEIGIWINNIEVSHMTVRIETNVLNSSSRYIPIQATLSGVYERDVTCEIRVDERCQIISASATMTRGSGGWSS